MANIIKSGEGMKVKLIGAMPRESYADIAANITRSEKTIDEIMSMPYNENLVKKVVDMSHLATTEFDYFIFLVEGLSRVTEIQLVRKRIASYLIKSGRINKGGKRSFDVVKPDSLDGFFGTVRFPIDRAMISNSGWEEKITDTVSGYKGGEILLDLSFDDLCNIIEQWYECGVRCGYPEEDLRYMKPQGTEFKGLIAMNAHALLDWFKIRCCNNAQHEIHDLAWEMLKLCKNHFPALFSNAGPSCAVLGYCPENDYQNKQCKGGILTHNQIKEMIKNHGREYLGK
jgi:thymidylate synthase (FAD)